MRVYREDVDFGAQYQEQVVSKLRGDSKYDIVSDGPIFKILIRQLGPLRFEGDSGHIGSIVDGVLTWTQLATTDAIQRANVPDQLVTKVLSAVPR